jgi:hypothetical protein
MLRQLCLTAMLGLSVCGGWAVSAGAQQKEGSDVAYQSARNKIGLLRYCRDKGLLDAVTADTAIEAIQTGLLRYAVGDGPLKERGDRAERVGASGLWQAGVERTLQSVADLFNTTTAALCNELAVQTRTIKATPKAVQRSPEATGAIPKVTTPTPPAKVGNSAAVVQPAPKEVPAASPDPSSPFEINKWRFNRREKPWGH